MTSVITALGQAFAGIVTGLCAMLAAYAARTPARMPMLLMVHRHLVGMALRLDRLAQRWQDGTLPRPRPSRAGKSRAAQRRSPVPRERFWLIHLVQPTAQYAGQVAAFLADPQTQALVAAAPQAGRILRPLCHALGLSPPPYLRLPPRAPRAVRPAPPRTPLAPIPPTGTPPRDLPHQVRAAARAWRPRRA